MMLSDYLKDHILITDGAMGTYYAQIRPEGQRFCELANLTDVQTIEEIHRAYLASGAKLIRTNTFSANTVTLRKSLGEIREIIVKGYEIARQAAAGSGAFVAANIGPIPDAINEEQGTSRSNILEEYKFIIDNFLDLGAEIFIFETFSSSDDLKDLTRYIKARNKACFILTQFALTVGGVTRKGIKAERIINEVKETGTIDAYGFNCGVGPLHLYHIVKNLIIPGDLVSVLPNAGYPELINERTVYVQNPDYFAEILLKIKDLGVKILGGCCGTTPAHIKKIAENLNPRQIIHPVRITGPGETRSKTGTGRSNLAEKMDRGKFCVAVELDPPYDLSLDRLLQGARVLKENGVDVITVADSPLGKARADSVIISAKINREAGIETLPHLCCRDRNLVSLRSSLMAAYIEGIRNVLAVTGDPIPELVKSEVKGVFHVNSFSLIKMIAEMNQDIFKDEPFAIGAALNLNVSNLHAEFLRMIRKVELGATFFLTQPVFSEQTIGFLAALKKERNYKILAGLLPLVTYRNALFINNELPGIKIPQEYVDRFDPDMKREEAEEAGIEITQEIARRIKPYVDGFYLITPFYRYEMVVKILKGIIS